MKLWKKVVAVFTCLAATTVFTLALGVEFGVDDNPAPVQNSYSALEVTGEVYTMGSWRVEVETTLVSGVDLSFKENVAADDVALGGALEGKRVSGFERVSDTGLVLTLSGNAETPADGSTGKGYITVKASAIEGGVNLVGTIDVLASYIAGNPDYLEYDLDSLSIDLENDSEALLALASQGTDATEFEKRLSAFYENTLLDACAAMSALYCLYYIDPAGEEIIEDYTRINEILNDISVMEAELCLIIAENAPFVSVYCRLNDITEADFEAYLESGAGMAEEVAALNNEILLLENEYYALDEEQEAERGKEIYAEWVAKQNELASLYKNPDGTQMYSNYIWYAFEQKYSRDYSPAQAVEFAENLLEILSDAYVGFRNEYMKYPQYLTDEELICYSDFYNYVAYDNYMEVLNEYAESIGGIYETEWNALWNGGNFFIAKSPDSFAGAFVYTIQGIDSFLYMGPWGYSSPNVVVHEFGHFLFSAAVPGVNASVDARETHSQSDEALFAAWIKGDDVSEYVRAAVPENVAATIADTTIYNFIYSIMQAAYLTLFEQKVFAADSELAEGEILSVSRIQEISDEVLALTGLDASQGLINTQWQTFGIRYPCYYVSYATSGIASLQMYFRALDDFESAKTDYLKLFEDETLAATDTYEEYMAYVNIASPFEEATLVELANRLSAYVNPLEKAE